MKTGRYKIEGGKNMDKLKMVRGACLVAGLTMLAFGIDALTNGDILGGTFYALCGGAVLFNAATAKVEK